MYKDAYTIHKQVFKHYIVPNVSNLPDKLPYPNNFLSFWFKYNAETICKAMNAAWRDGNRVNSFFRDK